MKLSTKEFEAKVRAIRNMTPAFSNGRRVVILSEYSKKGKQVLATASRWEGDTLKQVYDNPSEAKKIAFDEAYDMYLNSRHGTVFGICAHNAQMFSVSWVHDDGVTLLTNKTEYAVICNE